jgi:hypothetical protein
MSPRVFTSVNMRTVLILTVRVAHLSFLRPVARGGGERGRCSGATPRCVVAN